MRKKEIKELYDLEYETSESGKLIEKAVYIGDYFSFESKKYTKRKVTLGLLLGAIVLLGVIIVAGLLNTASSRNVFIGLPFIFTFLPIIYLFRGVFALMERPEPFTKVTYRNSIQRSMNCYKGLFVLFAYIVLASILYFLVKIHQIDWKNELFFVIFNITALLFSCFQIQYVSRVLKTIVSREQTTNIDNEPETLA